MVLCRFIDYWAQLNSAARGALVYWVGLHSGGLWACLHYKDSLLLIWWQEGYDAAVVVFVLLLVATVWLFIEVHGSNPGLVPVKKQRAKTKRRPKTRDEILGLQRHILQDWRPEDEGKKCREKGSGRLGEGVELSSGTDDDSAGSSTAAEDDDSNESVPLVRRASELEPEPEPGSEPERHQMRLGQGRAQQMTTERMEAAGQHDRSGSSSQDDVDEESGILLSQSRPRDKLSSRITATSICSVNRRPWVAPQRHCNRCGIVQPLRVKHCYDCGRCVGRFDHHCFWIATCVGERNHQVFYLFVLAQSLLGFYTVLVLFLAFPSQPKHQTFGEYTSKHFVLCASFACGLGTLPFVVGLAGYHTYLMLSAQTTWEHLRGAKIYYRA